MRMKAIEDDNTNKVRMVVVNFYEPTTRNVLQIKKAIEFDEMKAFYRLLMELKRKNQQKIINWPGMSLLPMY